MIFISSKKITLKLEVSKSRELIIFLHVTTNAKYYKKKSIKILIELNRSYSKGYKIEAICNNKVYAHKSDIHHLLDLYYLVSPIDYLGKKNLGAYISVSASLEVYQYFLQRKF